MCRVSEAIPRASRARDMGAGGRNGIGRAKTAPFVAILGVEAADETAR
jgi:hypothetical protein